MNQHGAARRALAAPLCSAAYSDQTRRDIPVQCGERSESAFSLGPQFDTRV